MLTAVAWPTVVIVSFIDQPTLFEIICSLNILDIVYICSTASVAPGHLVAEWEAGIGESSGEDIQVSALSHLKVYITP